MSTLSRLLDRVESALWDSQDAIASARGLQVTRVGRWQRRYRNPRVAIALAALAAREAGHPDYTDRPGRAHRGTAGNDRSERAA